jgi:hypothetical protein
MTTTLLKRSGRRTRPVALEPTTTALASEIDSIVEDRGVEIADLALVLAEIFEVPRGARGGARR